MRLRRFALFPSFLAVFGLTGCHQMQMQPLLGSAHPTYTITDLGVGTPYDINDQGQVVGHFPAGVFPKSHGFPYSHGCLWDKGKRIEMPTLGGWFSEASRVNDNGQILGTASVPRETSSGLPIEHLCLWNGHRLTDLDADPRFHGTKAVHITQSGAVYAVSPPQGPKKQLHLWLYLAGFSPGIGRDLGVIGGPKIKPMFINDSGMVVGTWNTVGERHAFVWHKGDTRWTDIGTFGGRDSEPTGMNNAGQVIGQAWLPDDPHIYTPRVHAFLWQKSRMKDLGTLPGSESSYANAINNKGQVIGYCKADSNGIRFRPVLWEHGQIKDLSLLIPSGTRWGTIDGAAAINDRGQIVGGGAVTNDQTKRGTYRGHAYLLTPH